MTQSPSLPELPPLPATTCWGYDKARGTKEPTLYTAEHVREAQRAHGLACYEAGSAAAAQAVQAVEPMFWVRLCSDNTYEGPIHNNSIERVRKASGAWSPLFLRTATAQLVEPAGWRSALEFYAQRSHFAIGDDDAWDTVSGEPSNFWCDEAGTATVEDGTVAAMALAGTPLPDDEDAAPTQGAEGAAPQAVVGEASERIALLETALSEVLEFQSAPEGPHIFDWGRWRRIRENTPPFQRAALAQHQPQQGEQR